MSQHPANTIDLKLAADRVFESLTGGRYWDDLVASLRPELANCGTEHAAYTLEACLDEGLSGGQDDIDPQSPQGIELLRRWATSRAPTCAAILRQLPIVDGHVRGHRMIACDPSVLRPALGLFWSHNFDDWPDPYAPWSAEGRDVPTLVIEAMIPVEAIDWQVSCMALMDWYCGDSESELRLLPGFPLREVRATWLEDGASVAIPDLSYTS